MKKLSLLLGCIFLSTTYAATIDHLNAPEKIYAVITSETKATLASPMAGYIENLYIKEGSKFKKGDILLQYDCKIEEAELQKADAEITLAKVNKDSYARLSKLGSASKMNVAEAQAQYGKAIAEQKIASKKVSDCQIKAPFNGQVTSLLVHQHETMQLHQELFSILSNDALVVRVLVPSNWMAWLKVGTAFKLQVRETHKTYSAVVERIVNQVDAVSRSVKIIGRLEGKYPDLKSGMSGSAIFQTDGQGNDQ